MCGTIPPLTQYVFMAWCLINEWITLHFVVLSEAYIYIYIYIYIERERELYLYLTCGLKNTGFLCKTFTGYHDMATRVKNFMNIFYMQALRFSSVK
jgi:hypothetical protein